MVGVMVPNYCVMSKDIIPDAPAIAEAVLLPPGSIAAVGLRGVAWARDREHECE